MDASRHHHRGSLNSSLGHMFPPPDDSVYDESWNLDAQSLPPGDNGSLSGFHFSESHDDLCVGTRRCPTVGQSGINDFLRASQAHISLHPQYYTPQSTYAHLPHNLQFGNAIDSTGETRFPVHDLHDAEPMSFFADSPYHDYTSPTGHHVLPDSLQQQTGDDDDSCTDDCDSECSFAGKCHGTECADDDSACVDKTCLENNGVIPEEAVDAANTLASFGGHEQPLPSGHYHVQPLSRFLDPQDRESHSQPFAHVLLLKRTLQPFFPMSLSNTYDQSSLV